MSSKEGCLGVWETVVFDDGCGGEEGGAFSLSLR